MQAVLTATRPPPSARTPCQHKCACQLQCRDASCTSAVEKCVADTRCDSIVLEDQKSWATLKRQPRPVELQLLEMRLMSARDAKEKVGARPLTRSNVHTDL